MIFITLKIVLAFMLTAIPVFYHKCIKPKQVKSIIWRSLFSLLCSAAPRICLFIIRVVSKLIHFHKHMKFSDNARKFFTFLLIILLLLVQVIDYLASIEVQEIHSTLSLQDINPMYQTTCCKDSISMILGDCCYPYSTPILLLFVIFIFTIALLNFKFINYILLYLKSDTRIFIVWNIFTVVYAIVDSGRYMIMAEWLYTLSLASIYFYPDKVINKNSINVV